MRTLIVLPWEERGGVTTVAENLAAYFRARRHEVLFFHPGQTVLLRTRTTQGGFPGVELRLCLPFAKPRPLVSTLAFPLTFPGMLLQLMSFLWSRRIQIVNLHYPTDHLFYFAVCRHLLPIRLVTSIHGGDAFDVGRPKSRYSNAFKFMLDSSDMIIVPSDAYRKRLQKVFPAVKGKTILIHNGADQSQFTPGSENGHKGNGRTRYILCVAQLRDYKGVDVLLNASQSLLTSDQSLEVVLAGDGPLRAELEALALSLGIATRTHFLGTLGPPEIAKLLQDCEILVLPSREDNCPLAVMEAMACRKPVVATEVGGIPEIIENDKSGILVRPEDPGALAAAIRHVLDNQELKRRLAENGYVRAMERFCFTHTGAAYEAAFASLLNGSKA